MVIIVLLLHLLICVLVGFAFWKKKLWAKSYLFPVVVCIPFWGLLLLVVEEACERGNQKKLTEIGLDTLKIQDVKYQRIEIDEQKNQEITVPLEEAMVVNEAPVTRRLMMDILHKNPGEYIDLLQTARSTEDTELAHYATTTMLEIQGKYEEEIHRLTEQLKQEPEDIVVLRKCRKELSNYINSNLLSGKILNIYRNQLDEILQRLCILEPDNPKYLTHFIENRIVLENYEGLEEKLEQLMVGFPEDENVYRTAVDYYWHIGQGKKIQEILGQVEQQEIYLSHAGKQWYQFWKQDEAGK